MFLVTLGLRRTAAQVCRVCVGNELYLLCWKKVGKRSGAQKFMAQLIIPAIEVS